MADPELELRGGGGGPSPRFATESGTECYAFSIDGKLQRIQQYFSVLFWVETVGKSNSPVSPYKVYEVNWRNKKGWRFSYLSEN